MTVAEVHQVVQWLMEDEARADGFCICRVKNKFILPRSPPTLKAVQFWTEPVAAERQ